MMMSLGVRMLVCLLLANDALFNAICRLEVVSTNGRPPYQKHNTFMVTKILGTFKPLTLELEALLTSSFVLSCLHPLPHPCDKHVTAWTVQSL